MKQITPITRISVGLTCLSVSLVLVAATIGLVPNEHAAIIEGRRTLSESVAVNCSLFAGDNEITNMKTSLRETIARDPGLMGVRVTRSDGSVLYERFEVASEGQYSQADETDAMTVSVPIVHGTQRWGSVALSFKPLVGHGILSPLQHPLTRMVTFIAVSSFVFFFVYMRGTLRYLDPSKVMPERVRHMLDTFAEGLMVVDKNERIVHTNEAFRRLVGLKDEDPRGWLASDFAWIPTDSPGLEIYPWSQAVTTPTFETGLKLGLNIDGMGSRTFLVNTSSILDDSGESCGALISMDDVTSLEASRSELRGMLDKLKKSRDEIRRQNRELEQMARIDPLTSCLNRRAFYADFESLWLIARRYDKPLSCIILDVDHFKSVNDRFGHSAGDEVLQVVAKTLRDTMRDSDLVCRYGGEEFCALLPETDVEAAILAAERTRSAIENADCGEVSVTASLGIAALEPDVTDPRELLNRADKAMYAAKHQGRNQVISWDAIRDEADQYPSEDSPAEANDVDDTPVLIPFPAVSALMSALSFRDAATAEHCQRVADFCEIMSTRHMTPGDAYHLEIAALLHDIGKIGIADAILLKPGQLTEGEWEIMRAHEQIGVTIIQEAFGSEVLTDLVRCHHAWFGGSPHNPSLPTGEQIPLGSRILAIAEAYDAMVSESVYRSAMDTETAFAELRKCAGNQFDPELVERFIAQVPACDQSRIGSQMRASREFVTGIVGVTENLARAVENRDTVATAAIARRLKAITGKEDSGRFTQVAARLERLAMNDPDSLEVTGLMGELLELCRDTQKRCMDNQRNCHPETDQPLSRATADDTALVETL